jgi:putative hydrolase
MICDFHTHTSLSDGELSPIEVIRRAHVNDYSAVALTDHVATGEMKRIIHETITVCALARKNWNIMAIPGVELTHLPAKVIPDAAKMAKELGAWIVVVHGETLVEPVEEGTNLAALSSPHVDILAHPGLLSKEEAELAAKNEVFLEISARHGHSLTNGHVAKLAMQTGAKLLLDSDSHRDSDFLTEDFAFNVLLGAGLDEDTCNKIMDENTEILVQKILSNHLV